MSASDAFNNEAEKPHNQKTTSPAVRALHQAAREGNVRDVIAMLRDGINPDARNSYGETALHFACREGHERIMHVLINAGADINAPNNHGETPIFKAMAQSNAEEMSLYMSAMVYDDRTGMLEAAEVARQRPHKERRMVLALIAAGANLNARTVDGRTPLHHAMHEGKPLVARELILRGADPGVKNSDGLKPLSRKNAHNAVQGGHMANLRRMAETVRGNRKLHQLKRRMRNPGG